MVDFLDEYRFIKREEKNDFVDMANYIYEVINNNILPSVNELKELAVNAIIIVENDAEVSNMMHDVIYDLVKYLDLTIEDNTFYNGVLPLVILKNNLRMKHPSYRNASLYLKELNYVTSKLD
jgi:hypothetical protein